MRRVLLCLPVVCALIPLFAYAQSLALVIVGIMLWGVSLGIQESTMRAAVADIVPTAHRATAYGFFSVSVGIGSLLGGALAIVAGLALAEAFLLPRRARLGRRGGGAMRGHGLACAAHRFACAVGSLLACVGRLFHNIERVLERFIGIGVVHLVLDNLVHLLLRIAELADGLAKRFRHCGQLVGAEQQETEQQNEK